LHPNKLSVSFCLVVYLFIAAIISCSDNPSSERAISSGHADPLFTLLLPDQTHISFQNTLTETINANVLMYEYIYNGGGVAVADVNGDGLQDIYFVGNMTSNKLYLNKGKMQFEDITDAAGVAGRPGPWKTGVTMVDINGDGKEDIYVCYSGKLTGPQRVNQLFINEGNDASGIPHFSEQAEKYGLADSAYSNQAVFFDYDRDGDLDMFLLNHYPKSLPVLDEAATAEVLRRVNPMTGVRLYRNDGGRFADITEKTGISSSDLTYGLGAGVMDLDGDGWTDIYVSNDYGVPDYLYINNRDGTFTDRLQQQLGHFSNFSMGNDIADINNDGLPDIITLDMLPEDDRRQKLLFTPDSYEKFDLALRSGFYYNYMRNMLQYNNGNGTFSEIGQLAGISNTDWSWAPLAADYDNDGWKDLFITNGFVRDFTDMDFLKLMGGFLKDRKVMRQDLFDLVQKIPSSDVVNYIFKNNGNLTFSNMQQAWGINSPSNSNGAAYADLDNDGDLDLVINNINLPAFVYENNAGKKADNHYLQIKLQGDGLNTNGIGAKVTLFSKGKQQYIEQIPARGYQSSVSPILHFGLGKDDVIDSLSVIWLSGKAQYLTNLQGNRLITLKESDADNKYTAPKRPLAIFEETRSPIAFTHSPNNINDFKRQPLMVNPMSFFGPCLISGDVNGDGREDIFAGGATGQPAQLWLQKANGGFEMSAQAAFEADNIYEDTDAVFFDADGDGDADLYVVSGGYHGFTDNDNRLQDRLYLNDGKGRFIKADNALPQMYVSKSCVRAGDFDGDGDMDLFVGGRVIPGRYPETPESFLLVNDGTGKFENKIPSLAPALQKAGMVTDAAWHDLNDDGKPDLIVVGEWMPAHIFMNEDGKLTDQSGRYFDKTYNGWWNRILLHDLNGDGKKDLVLGNMGLNTQCRASDKEPAEMFFKDFDANGSVDPMLTFYIQGRSYPYVTRDELLDQITTMRSRYTSYKDYAGQTLADIFKNGELKDAGYLTANHLETSYFEWGTDNKFHLRDLPLEVQMSPVFTITPLDYNKDGNIDLLLCGNIDRARIRFGRYDANYGILLKGDGKGKFEYVPQWQSGFSITGDVRSVVVTPGGLLFGMNRLPVKMYRLR